jgi:hypothetical protein
MDISYWGIGSGGAAAVAYALWLLFVEDEPDFPAPDTASPATPVKPLGGIPDSVRDQVWDRDEGCCVFCGSRRWVVFDHIVPVGKGGTDTVQNLRLLCDRCHRRRFAL